MNKDVGGKDNLLCHGSHLTHRTGCGLPGDVTRDQLTRTWHMPYSAQPCIKLPRGGNSTDAQFAARKTMSLVLANVAVLKNGRCQVDVPTVSVDPSGKISRVGRDYHSMRTNLRW